MAAEAIRTLRPLVRWKPKKDEQHVAKRKAMGHLPDEATLNDYNEIIRAILGQANALVYRYPFGSVDYYAVTGEVEGAAWLVIFSADGIIETAFPPKDLADYLGGGAFCCLDGCRRSSMSKVQQLLEGYAKGVDFPEASGFEVLELLGHAAGRALLGWRVNST